MSAEASIASAPRLLLMHIKILPICHGLNLCQYSGHIRYITRRDKIQQFLLRHLLFEYPTRPHISVMQEQVERGFLAL